MKKVIIILVCLFLLGCSNDKKVYSYQKIDSDKALEIMHENSNYVILDVRTREEFDEEHLDNALNVPVEEINELIPIDLDSIIFVYCKSGVRSKEAALKLIDMGYMVYDLGGYNNINLEE